MCGENQEEEYWQALMHLIASSSSIGTRQTGARRIRRHHWDSDLAPCDCSNGRLDVLGALDVYTSAIFLQGAERRQKDRGWACHRQAHAPRLGIGMANRGHP